MPETWQRCSEPEWPETRRMGGRQGQVTPGGCLRGRDGYSLTHVSVSPSSCKPSIPSNGYAWHCFPGAVRGQFRAHPPAPSPPFWEGGGATWPGDQGVLSPGCPRQLPCSSSSELRESLCWQEGTPGCLAATELFIHQEPGLLVSVIVPWELG